MNPEKLEILVFANTNPFFTSSASANRLRSLLEGCVNLGASVQLFILNGYQSKLEKKQLGKSGLFNGVQYSYINRSLLDNVWKRRFHRYLGQKVNALTVSHKVKKIICHSQGGVIWVNKSYFLWQILHRLRKKDVTAKYFTEMSEYLDIHKFNKGNTLQKRAGDRSKAFFEEKFYYDLDGFALMTRTLYKHYNNFASKDQGPQLLHLPMTVDLERFSAKAPPIEGFQTPYLVYIGVLNNAKDGIDILIESFSNLSTKWPELKLYLVGSWHYDTPSHLKKIKEYGLESRIIWKGAYPRDQIPAILQYAKLLVMPRPDSKQAQGGFPTKLGEYLASGKPVCATTVGEIPDYLVDNESVFFAEPGSVESFAETMHRALRDPEHAKRVGENGRKVAEKAFNKDIQTKKLYDFLMTLWEA